MLAGTILLVVVVILAIGAGWVGLLETPTYIHVRKQGPMVVAYARETGGFDKISGTLNLIKKKLHTIHISPGHAVGFFFDDPDEVESEKLRWWTGYAIPEDEALDTIRTTYPELQLVKLVPSEVVHSSFTWRNFFSPMIGAWKVYPKLESFLAENNFDKKLLSPAVEVYEDSKIIHYVIYLENREDLVWN